MLIAYATAIAVLAGVTSWLLSGWAIARLGAADVVDRPDARRVGHGVTPRGGGVVFVIVWSTASVVIWPAFWLLVLAGMIVASVGFIDDVRGLPAAIRFSAHVIASVSVFGLVPDIGPVAAAVIIFLGVGHTNAFNFMDGSNGLAAMQAIFIAGAAAIMSGLAGKVELVLIFVVLAGSVAGFLPHNFPVARGFMGDVGSTFLGFIIALLLVIAWSVGALSLAAVLSIPALFITDASLTFLFRLATGQRWYTAHREHAYQRLIDRGASATTVFWIYAALNLFLVLPVAVAGSMRPAVSIIGLYAVLAVLWTITQRRTRHG